MPGVVVVFVAILALAPTPFLGALIAWARLIRRRTATPPTAVWPAYALTGLGAVSSTVGVVAAVRSVTSGSLGEADGASGKARALGEAISWALNCGTAAIVASAVAGLWLLFATCRRRWKVKPPEGCLAHHVRRRWIAAVLSIAAWSR